MVQVIPYFFVVYYSSTWGQTKGKQLWMPELISKKNFSFTTNIKCKFLPWVGTWGRGQRCCTPWGAAHPNSPISPFCCACDPKQPFQGKSPAALSRTHPSPSLQVSPRGLSCSSSPEHLPLLEELLPCTDWHHLPGLAPKSLREWDLGGSGDTAELGSRRLPDHSSCCFPG